jgi:hypothetical protein
MKTLLALCVLVTSVSIFSRSDEGLCSVNGVVGIPLRGWIGFGAGGAALRNMEIKLLDSKRNLLNATMSDDEGWFSFPKTVSGTYYFVAKSQATANDRGFRAELTVRVIQESPDFACLSAEPVRVERSKLEKSDGRITYYSRKFLACKKDGCIQSNTFDASPYSKGCALRTLNGDGAGGDRFRTFQVFVNGKRVSVQTEAAERVVEVQLRPRNTIHVIADGEGSNRMEVSVTCSAL